MIRAGLCVLLSVGFALSGGTARADLTPDPETGGGSGDGEIWATAGDTVVFEGDVGDGGQKPGNLTATQANWDPPPCWYAPWLGARDFKAQVKPSIEEQMQTPGMPGHAGNALAQMLDHYEDGYSWPNHPGYENWNIENEGKGMFWAGVENPAEEDVLKRTSCSEVPFWVDNGDPPPPFVAEEAIDPQMLAELAYERMRVPETEAELRPGGEQTVNLPTWVWLDEAEFQPVSVTARVPVLDMWATTTATPVSLTIDPGTEDAALHPDGGECAINDDGTIGTPYRRGDSERIPPCGVTYLRSTESSGAYDFKAAVTWQVSWSASDGTEDEPLPSGVIEATEELDVQEIQTVVR